MATGSARGNRHRCGAIETKHITLCNCFCTVSASTFVLVMVCCRSAAAAVTCGKFDRKVGDLVMLHSHACCVWAIRQAVIISSLLLANTPLFADIYVNFNFTDPNVA